MRTEKRNECGNALIESFTRNFWQRSLAGLNITNGGIYTTPRCTLSIANASRR